MKKTIFYTTVFLIGMLLFSTAYAADRSQTKPRILILTDIENEPDDAQSLVRFLLYANQFDIEGIIATTSIHQRNRVAAWRIQKIVDAYAKVRSNLEKHEQGYPSVDFLKKTH